MVGRISTLSARLTRWYRRHRRDLPWRAAPDAPDGARPDPYHVLVSETMLQQTQVATVVPYFLRFIRELPTIRHLAAADEQRILRLWQGLGYYARARNLRQTARIVVERFGGQIPSEIEHLRELPGVGRYTAGAVASLAFGRREPLVDGNVARVICRLDRIESDPRSGGTQKRIWFRAAQILPQRDVADFNSALMELGATVCTPRTPGCAACPIRGHCEAFAGALQDRIPPHRSAKALPLVRRQTWCIRRMNGRGVEFLIERRPCTGRWAGMWQFVTRPKRPRQSQLRRPQIRCIGRITHGLTHRRYQFEVLLCDSGFSPGCEHAKGAPGATRWVRLDQLDEFPLPRPHLRIARMLSDHLNAGGCGSDALT